MLLMTLVMTTHREPTSRNNSLCSTPQGNSDRLSHKALPPHPPFSPPHLKV